MVRNLPPPPPPRNFKAISRQPRKLIFGMQPYFDPTRKTTSKKVKNGRRPQKKKWKATLILRLSYLDYLTTKNLKLN
jgi:hypothetical protein